MSEVSSSLSSETAIGYSVDWRDLKMSPVRPDFSLVIYETSEIMHKIRMTKNKLRFMLILYIYIIYINRYVSKYDYLVDHANTQKQ